MSVETIDHFAHGLGLRVLEPLLEPAYPIYRAAMAVVAVLVSVAILGLAFRRFVLVKSRRSRSCSRQRTSPYGVLDDEVCCGHPSRRQGEEVQYAAPRGS